MLRHPKTRAPAADAEARRTAPRWTRAAPGAREGLAAWPPSHADCRRVGAHLHAVHERRAAANGSRDVHRLGHLVEVRPFLEGVLAIGVDAVGALHGVGDRERDERLLARG